MMNCQANYAAHLAAALPNHMMMEVVDPGREQCINFNHTIEDGFIQLSNDPGLGITIDEEALANLQQNPPEPNRRRKNPFPRRRRRRPLHRPTHQRRGALVGGVSNNSLRLLPTISTA